MHSNNIYTTFIEDITHNYRDIDNSFFKSIAYLNGIHYTCERVCKNGRNGLYFKIDNTESYREEGFNIEAEDPRLFEFNSEIYVIFNCISPYQNQNRCLAISSFNHWNPRFLRIENFTLNKLEKNWSPFEKNNQLYLIYNYDPLIILYYDFNEEGICDVVFTQNNVKLPMDTSKMYLRGGSNFVNFNNNYYIGLCHCTFNDYYNTQLVLLDTSNSKWKIVYLSKPLMFNDENNSFNLKKIKDTTIICDTNTLSVPDRPFHIIYPTSLIKDNGYYIASIMISERYTLLFELLINIKHDDIKQYKIGEIQELTYLYNKKYILKE